MKQFEIGALIGYHGDLEALDADFARLQSLQLNACQLNVWPGYPMDEAHAEAIKASAAAHGIHITALWAGWSAPAVWDFYEGPTTLGIVPEQYREKRIAEIKEEAAEMKEDAAELVEDVKEKAAEVIEEVKDTFDGQ